MIALINRGVLPIYYKVPFIGETTFLTQSFLYNCQLLFFRGPFKCIFEKNWLINEDVKSPPHRQVIAKKLDRNIVILALINLFLSPVLFIWQILYFFYSNAALVKRDPVVLGLRNWSLYSRWFCRHFNELDHQLNDRLNHAYKPAKNYMDAFTSPLLEIFARHIRFVAGSTFAVLLILTVYDEDVIQVVHLLTIVTGLWLIWSSAGGFIPPEVPPRFTKSELYEQILQNIHYVPHNYPPFTPQARKTMSELFQYKIIKLLEDLLSTLATPYIMIRHLRPRSLDIVDFFRNYTVVVPGTGDVCVFSMMNIKENGNPQWQPMMATPMQDMTDKKSEVNKSLSSEEADDDSQPSRPTNVQQFERETFENPALPMQTEHGKLELSLINFKMHNPSWNPSSELQRDFIQQVTTQAIEKAVTRQKSPLTSDTLHDPEELRSQFYVNHGATTSSYLARGGRSQESSAFQRPKSPPKITDVDSSTAVSLSTLFLHEHARMPLSSNFPSTSSSTLLTQTRRSSRNDKSSENHPLL